jgi:hypothetical protein
MLGAEEQEVYPELLDLILLPPSEEAQVAVQAEELRQFLQLPTVVTVEIF